MRPWDGATCREGEPELAAATALGSRFGPCVTYEHGGWHCTCMDRLVCGACKLIAAGCNVWTTLAMALMDVNTYLFMIIGVFGGSMRAYV